MVSNYFDMILLYCILLLSFIIIVFCILDFERANCNCNFNCNFNCISTHIRERSLFMKTVRNIYTRVNRIQIEMVNIEPETRNYIIV